ncbi:MAG: hemerythrin family protein [Methylobacter sp.]|nr:hemerythrin family protein [Methylobacter sp.]MDP2428853.1 hemerythrin family protein [Methylobacter sp.]MDP3053322.1 hemerythrin family protein [Methylobacter sp.]MDP3362082.1 hemerythrin family protein [Methylobacter sp.]MDZ4218459.1 hemerythrin family protein [Methylobacter sp.]
MLAWSDSFATKIELVDFQHQKLFELLNRLSDNFKQGDPSETIVNETLLELIAYADKHFIDEELLMLHSKLDPRHINIHRMEHKSFIYDARSMYEHLCTSEDLIEVAEKLVRFITSWLTFHILGIDHSMAAQMAAIKQGASPEQAYEARRTLKYDADVTHLMLDSILDLWHMSLERCHKLEEKLAILESLQH